MGTNTISKLQVYDIVPIATPNAGKPSYRDATPAEIVDQVFNEELKRINAVTSISASVAQSFNPKLAKIISIFMDASIANLTTIANGTFDGQQTIIKFRQDAVGGKTVNWNTAFFAGGQDQGLPILFGAPLSVDWVLLVWNATTNKQNIVAHVRNYV